MSLTRDFKASLRARLVRDSKFRKALFVEGVKCLLCGELVILRTILRAFVQAGKDVLSSA